MVKAFAGSSFATGDAYLSGVLSAKNACLERPFSDCVLHGKVELSTLLVSLESTVNMVCHGIEGVR